MVSMSKELTLERLAQAIIQTKKEVMYLKTELEKVQSYLREQHKLKKQLKKQYDNIQITYIRFTDDDNNIRYK